MLTFTSLFIICFSSLEFWLADSQSADTVVIPSAKKSIFATSDADRVNDFIAKAFEPQIQSGKLQDLYSGEMECGSPSKFRFESGFEIHSPYTPQHESGGLEVEELEFHYAQKWDNLLSAAGQSNGWFYDAILDNSMAFWVTDLSDYDEYNEEDVDRLYFQWQWDDKTYYSIFLHNSVFPGDLNQFELISDTFSSKTERQLNSFVETEPRAVFDRSLGIDYKMYSETTGYDIISIGIKRAVSDVGANLEWYLSVFSETITPKEIVKGESTDANGNTVKYGHVLLDSQDGFTVSFYERIVTSDTHTTYGDLLISDIENKLNTGHNNIMVNPFCCVDRWYDMHYAIPLETDVAALTTLKTVMNSGDRYLVYYNQKVENTLNAFDDLQEAEDDTQVGVFWTLVEPNGQMVQIPGILIDTSDWTTESGSTVEFFVDPTYWDGDWCPMDNIDDFKQFSFGDDIAKIEIVRDNEMAAKINNDLQKNENVNVNGKTLKTKTIVFGKEIDPQNVNNGLIKLLVLVVTMIVFIIVGYGCGKTNSNNKRINKSLQFETYKNNKNKNNNIKYTYKTFQDL